MAVQKNDDLNMIKNKIRLRDMKEFTAPGYATCFSLLADLTRKPDIYSLPGGFSAFTLSCYCRDAYRDTYRTIPRSAKVEFKGNPYHTFSYPRKLHESVSLRIIQYLEQTNSRLKYGPRWNDLPWSTTLLYFIEINSPDLFNRAMTQMGIDRLRCLIAMLEERVEANEEVAGQEARNP